MSPLPDSWDDEPWPLDDPIPAPGLRPTNWSDTHADPPQVADLADEAWQRAMDRGISMERALAELQREQMGDGADRASMLSQMFWSRSRIAYTHTFTPTKIAHYVPSSQAIHDDLTAYFDKVSITLTADPSPVVSAMRAMSDQATGDRVLAETKAAPLVPSWQWDACRDA